MKSKIRTAHEENFSQGDKTKVLGVLDNYSIDEDWHEGFPYIYHDEMYIFFNTIIEMMEYLLYGEKKMKRAYMEEQEFDTYYDAEYLDCHFKDKLNWL